MKQNTDLGISKGEAQVAINRAILYIRQFDTEEDKVIRDHHNNLVDFEGWLFKQEEEVKDGGQGDSKVHED